MAAVSRRLARCVIGKLIVGVSLGLVRARDRPLTAALTAHFLVWAAWGSV